MMALIFPTHDTRSKENQTLTTPTDQIEVNSTLNGYIHFLVNNVENMLSLLIKDVASIIYNRN